MDNNISQMSLLEVAYMLMCQKRTKQPIKKLIKEVLEVKGMDDPDGSFATQLYIDITTCSKFVFLGNEEWDLKERQSLDEWDKDGSAFNSKEDYDDLDDDDDDLDDDLESEDYDDLDDEKDEDSDDDDDDDDDDLDSDDDSTDPKKKDSDDDLETDEDGEPLERYDETDFDEDKYNDLMDDFEDMYDEN